MKKIKENWLYVFVTIFIIKILGAALLPMSADEAYYWVWSQRPQLSYYDHPPFVSWLFAIGHLFQLPATLVRLPAVFLSQLTLLVAILFIQKKDPTINLVTALIVLFVHPLFNLGSLIVTPDLPVIFFWILSAYIWNQYEDQQRWSYSILFGLSLGLGFTSKYHIVLFLPGFFIYLFVNKKMKFILNKHLLFIVIAGLVGSLPVIIWNLQNQFASFTFQLAHGLEKSQKQVDYVLPYVLSQFFILSPILIHFFYYHWQQIKKENLFWTGIFPVGFFFLTSFRTGVEGNWPTVGYLGLYLLYIIYQRSIKPLVLYFFTISLVVFLAMTLNLWNAGEKLKELNVIQEIAPKIKDYQPLYASRYQFASQLWFEYRQPVYKLKNMSRIDFYDYMPESLPRVNQFYLLKHQGDQIPPWVRDENYQIEDVLILDHDLVLQRIYK